MGDMALIEANSVTLVVPADADAAPATTAVESRLALWLEVQYGYLPPVEGLAGLGWSDRWDVAGRTAAGWAYRAEIPRHLGPARDPFERSRAHHPARRSTTRRSG